MKQIKVLGSGCANCEATLKLIEEQAKAQGIEVQLEKIEDVAAIAAYGVMSTPGVVVDERVVHAGGVPSSDMIKLWLGGGLVGRCAGNANAESCCGG
jgi:small redox-active disulfide protein 2